MTDDNNDSDNGNDRSELTGKARVADTPDEDPRGGSGDSGSGDEE